MTEIHAGETCGGDVALVTGASRGLGRGIAIALGAAGWKTLPRPSARRAVSGSRPSAHRDDEQVRAVVRRVAAESGGLRLLVNNAWAGYERLNAGGWDAWNAPFWEQPIELWDAMFTGGVRAHYVATALCAPLPRATPAAAVVTISMHVCAGHEAGYGWPTAWRRRPTTASRWPVPWP